MIKKEQINSSIFRIQSFVERWLNCNKKKKENPRNFNFFLKIQQSFSWQLWIGQLSRKWQPNENMENCSHVFFFILPVFNQDSRCGIPLVSRNLKKKIERKRISEEFENVRLVYGPARVTSSRVNPIFFSRFPIVLFRHSRRNLRNYSMH